MALIYVLLVAVLLLTQQQQAASQAPALENGGPAANKAPRVLIVGAGLSGIVAARDLIDAGVKDVTVLEARNRPGGRLHSTKTRAGNVDLGAMWLHEAGPNNTLYRFVKDKLQMTLSEPVEYMQGQVFKTDGTPEDTSTFVSAYMAITMKQLPKLLAIREKEAAAIKSGAKPPTDKPISELYAQTVADNKADWAPGQLEATNALMCIGSQVMLNSNLTQLSSLRYYDTNKRMPNVDVHVKPGFDAVIMKLLPGIQVKYNSVVQSITDKGRTVTVTLATGTELSADYVIVTVPLGVLKEGTIKFTPALPAAKQDAIKNMGMGVLDKVVLVFDEKDVFWDKKVDFVIMASPDLTCKWTAWLSYYRIFQWPVLVAFHSADTAKVLEAKTDKEVVDEALKVLRRSYGDVPAPVESYVTRWAQDPWSRGAYSYYAVENPKGITDTLAAPHGRILFAGEATSDKAGLVLGALLSGQREAQRVQKLAGIK